MRQAAILSGLALLAACGSSAASGEQRTVPLGTWGGDHIVLEVAAGGATVELDCAHGAIERSDPAGADGRFDGRRHLRPGARRAGAGGRGGDARPARYAGRVEGETMTLTIAVGDGGETLGPFELVRGRSARLTKCL